LAETLASLNRQRPVILVRSGWCPREGDAAVVDGNGWSVRLGRVLSTLLGPEGTTLGRPGGVGAPDVVSAWWWMPAGCGCCFSQA
jgi:hypothetical protein